MGRHTMPNPSTGKTIYKTGPTAKKIQKEKKDALLAKKMQKNLAAKFQRKQKKADKEQAAKVAQQKREKDAADAVKAAEEEKMQREMAAEAAEQKEKDKAAAEADKAAAEQALEEAQKQTAQAVEDADKAAKVDEEAAAKAATAHRKATDASLQVTLCRAHEAEKRRAVEQATDRQRKLQGCKEEGIAATELEEEDAVPAATDVDVDMVSNVSNDSAALTVPDSSAGSSLDESALLSPPMKPSAPPAQIGIEESNATPTTPRKANAKPQDLWSSEKRKYHDVSVTDVDMVGHSKVAA